jgi:Flp pilus assembly protein TadD
VDLNRALGWAQEAVRKSPENSSYRNTLGLVYYKHGLIEQAIAVFPGEEESQRPALHLHLAMALYAANMKLRRRWLRSAS